MKDINIEALEQMIDSSSLSQLLSAIAFVCGEKSEHLRSNWQDEAAAQALGVMHDIVSDISSDALARGL